MCSDSMPSSTSPGKGAPEPDIAVTETVVRPGGRRVVRRKLATVVYRDLETAYIGVVGVVEPVTLPQAPPGGRESVHKWRHSRSDGGWPGGVMLKHESAV